jgi:serine/threonine protein kinase
MANVAAAPSPDEEPSRLIGGRYRLIAELGRGGMGVTYRAWDTRAGVPVVIKMPNDGQRANPEALIRFAREIEAMRQLAHDHIVPIIDQGEDNGCPYVVMRFLPCGSLAELRPRADRPNAQPHVPGMLHWWLPTIAAALDFMHGRGVLHRDVKPANVFFDGYWNAFLGDFGIAKVIDGSGGIAKEQTLTATQFAMGTPEYMAPELFLPRATPTGRSDQYSLAVTVYEMLAGRKPFTGESAHIVVEQSTFPVPPLDRAKLGLPSSLCAAIEKALSKNPEDRFESCTQFAASLLRDVLPPTHEPNVVRLLCPKCTTILRLPSLAGGRTGKCPSCKASLSIAKDFSALWLAGEDHSERRSLDQSPSDSATRLPPAPPLRPWLLALGLAAALLIWVVSHRRWAAYHEQAVAELAAKHATEMKAAELAGAVKLAAAEEQMAAEADAQQAARVKDLEEEVAQLETMVDEGQAEIQRLKEKPQAEESESEGQMAAADNSDTAEQEAAMKDGSGEEDEKAGERIASTIQTSQVLAARFPALAYETLTVQQAKELMRESPTRKQLNLNKLTELTPEVAKTLAPADTLLLDGIKECSPEAAKELVKRKWSTRVFSGMSTLDVDVIKALAQHEGRLHLNGVSTLSDAQAEELAKARGLLCLDGLATLTDAQAEALAKHQGDLSLNGLKTITTAQAESLAKQNSFQLKAGSWPQCSLYLNGLESLSDAQAKELAKHAGHLSLNGLEAITDAQAEAFAKLQGNLQLNGLATLTDAQALSLAKPRQYRHRHGRSVKTNGFKDWYDAGASTSLLGLTSVSATAAASLRANQFIMFPQR